MTRPAIRRLALSLLVFGGLSAPACGGGSGHGGVVLSLSSATPNQFSPVLSTLITLHGADFGAGGAGTVTLTAASGTPFSGSATVIVPATVVDDTTATFSSPLATVCPPANVGLGVHLALPGGATVDAAGTILVLASPTLAAVPQSPVPAGPATAITLQGTGFGPAFGVVTVTFTAATGTPFVGGTSATASVSGTIASSTAISTTSPVASGSYAASVSVAFPGGSCAESAGPVLVGLGVALTTTASADLLVAQGDRVSFTVTATAVAASTVTLRLLDPPAGLTMPTVVLAASPAVATVAWVAAAEDDAGPIPLVFQASDAVDPSVRTTLVLWLHETPRAVRTVRVGDVTGDGKLDVVVSARNADVGGVGDVGAIYVWAGATVPSGAPTATLTVPGAIASDRLASGGFRLVDVTGDGVLDVVAAADGADAPGFVDQGAIYVWKGGIGLVGSRAPDATLVTGGGGASIGLAASPLLWQVGDVSGDGTADVVAAAPFADVAVGDAGSLYVWKGGAGLTGAKTPDATLVVTGALVSDELGLDGLQLADLTGDGILDVFSAAPRADVGGTGDAGALYLWKGGATLTGTVAATATMTATGASPNDRLGAGAGTAVRLTDVTDDGVADVVVAVPTAVVGGVGAAGAIYVWKGGATLTGALTQTATLTLASPLSNDALGSGPHTRLLIGDVSGDGKPDVVGVASTADVSGVFDAGEACVWFGGGTLVGTKTPDATLRVAGAFSGDALGKGGTRLADVTGDGTLDVVAAAPLADVGGVGNAGAVYVWAGGASLTGVVSPTATLAASGAVPDDRLASDPADLACTFRFADVSGDGVLDVIVPDPLADVGGVGDAGAIYVWDGGAALTGAVAASARLIVAGAAAGDRLGQASGSFVAAADVSGDGIFDVVAASSSADVGAALDAGALYAWRGGATLVGTKSADATLVVAGAHSGDALAGNATDGVTWDLYDLTGDGVRDVVAVACRADSAVLIDSGAGHLWAGGSTLVGVQAPTATFLAPSATNGDFLGRTGAAVDLLFAADVTGDGTADLILGSSEYTGVGSFARGGLFEWSGGTLSGSPAPTAAFLVAGAAVQDRLGN